MENWNLSALSIIYDEEENFEKYLSETKNLISNSTVSQANQSFIPGLVSEMYSFKGLEITLGNNPHKIDKSSFLSLLFEGTVSISM